ncbi:hypothetical protein, partial [Streptomyces niveus]
LKGGQDNVREGERGFGVELSTQAQGAPGKVEFKASQRDWVGPLISSEETDVPAGQFSGCEPHLNAAVCRQEGCADVG